MQPLEQTLRYRYPHWFGGRRARLAQPVLRGLMRLPRMDAVEQFLQRSGHLRDFKFVSATLAHLQACHVVGGDGLQRLPASGRLLIVANHPSGALDAPALLDAVGKVRRDVRIVANDVLSLLQPLAGLLLPARIFGGKAGATEIRAIEQSLEHSARGLPVPTAPPAAHGCWHPADCPVCTPHRCSAMEGLIKAL